MLTRKAKYALRALVVLARNPGQPMPAHRIAREARVPEKFLETILVELRLGGFVESRRGLQGGHALARPAESIAVGDLIRCIDGPIAPLRCASVTAFEPCTDCPDPARCAVRDLMADVREAMSGVLDHRSLRALAEHAAALEPLLVD
ncbi:RrF2 family transcriptional regulator [Silanimonas sp.]|jgi:Rrf2 family protein|uniref:RrF2 family transcriptional regulator n=1 Tax=Silanimonas sp. TaxID=1929290 RepID=UPI0037C755AF